MFGFASFAQTPFASLAGNLFPFSIAEGIAVDDFSAQVSAFLQTIDEPTILDDVDSITGNFFALVYEDTGLADSSSELSAYLQSISENSFPADSVSIQAAFASLITENFDLADTSAVVFEFLFSILESIPNLADSSTQQFNFVQAIAEPVTVQSVESITAQFVQSIAEATTLADAVNIVAQFAVSISENANLGDTAVIVSIFDLSITEIFTVEDSNTASQGFNFVIGENVQMLFATQTQFNFLQSIVEVVVIGENTVALGWIQIIDNTNANWATINTIVVPSWNVINTQ